MSELQYGSSVPPKYGSSVSSTSKLCFRQRIQPYPVEAEQDIVGAAPESTRQRGCSNRALPAGHVCNAVCAFCARYAGSKPLQQLRRAGLILRLR